MTKLTERDLDEAIRRNRREWDDIELMDNSTPLPWSEFMAQASHSGCAGLCQQGRAPCTCGRVAQATRPDPRTQGKTDRWAAAIAVAVMLVLSIYHWGIKP